MQIDLNDCYIKMMKQEREESERIVRKGKIYISTLSACKCDYQMRCIFEGIEKDKELNVWYGIENTIGTCIHTELQKVLLKNKFIVDVEKEVLFSVKGVKIRCKIDGVFANNNILELKTIGPKDYKIKEPKEEHLLQANFYAGLNKGQQAIISYFKRENGLHLISFKIDFDKEMYDNMYNRLENIIDNNELSKNYNSCQYCNYKEYCLGEKNL